MRLPSWLKAGDVVELGIDGRGELRQKLLAYEAAEAVYAHPRFECVERDYCLRLQWTGFALFARLLLMS